MGDSIIPADISFSPSHTHTTPREGETALGMCERVSVCVCGHVQLCVCLCVFLFQFINSISRKIEHMTHRHSLYNIMYVQNCCLLVHASVI